MRIEYELDYWNQPAVTRSLEIEPDDYRGLTVAEIKHAVYQRLSVDAESDLHHTHLIYSEDEVVEEILAAQSDSED